MKRFIDVVIAASALIIFSPVLMAIACLIVVTSGWPVIYSQDRVGLHGRPFRFYKFKTLYEGSERMVAPISERNDPRITLAGRLLRPSHLDELPQLWNVLKGDMSIVGPRPYTVDGAKQHTLRYPAFAKRHAIRPGITGLVQVFGRMRALRKRTVAYADLYYVRHRSIWMDLWIMVRTVRTVIGRHGF